MILLLVTIFTSITMVANSSNIQPSDIKAHIQQVHILELISCTIIIISPRVYML